MMTILAGDDISSGANDDPSPSQSDFNSQSQGLAQPQAIEFDDVLVDAEARFAVKRIFDKLESFDLADDLKSSLRKRFERALESGESLDELEEMLSDFEDFMKARTNKISKRDKMLFAAFEEIPLWGGPLVSVYGECIPAEAATEKLFWSREIMVSLFEGVISFSEAMQKMDARLQHLSNIQQLKQVQVESFFKARDLVHDKSDRSIRQYLSQARFIKADFSARKKIVLKLASILKEKEEAKEWAWARREEFLQYLTDLDKRAQNSSDEVAWQIYDDLLFELKISGLQKEVFYEEWLSYARVSQASCEAKISGKVQKMAEELKGHADPKKTTMAQKKRFHEYLDYLSQIPPKLKLKGGWHNLLISTELKLLEHVNDGEEGVEEDEAMPTREGIFEMQKNNDWVRRFLQSIAALSMSMGKDTNVSNLSQKSLVREDRVSKETFAQRQGQRLEHVAAEKMNLMQDDLNADLSGDIDVVSATQSSKEDFDVNVSDTGLEVAVSEEKQQEHKTSYWEMLRISGVKPWPAEANERYLREVLASGRHLTLTDNYMVISAGKAKSLLRERLVKNLAKVPGKSAQTKQVSINILAGLISEATNSSSDFVRKLFSYTGGKATRLAA